MTGNSFQLFPKMFSDEEGQRFQKVEAMIQEYRQYGALWVDPHLLSWLPEVLCRVDCEAASKSGRGDHSD